MEEQQKEIVFTYRQTEQVEPVQLRYERDLPPCMLRQEPAFLERFKALLREKVSREWNGLYSFTDTEQREFYLSFLVGGVVGLIQLWMESGQKESPQEMAALAESMILHGIQPLEKF